MLCIIIIKNERIGKNIDEEEYIKVGLSESRYWWETGSKPYGKQPLNFLLKNEEEPQENKT